MGSVLCVLYLNLLPEIIVAGAAIESPTSSVSTPSPLSSREKVVEENVGLQRQLEQYKDLLHEKKTQLI